MLVSLRVGVFSILLLLAVANVAAAGSTARVTGSSSTGFEQVTESDPTGTPTTRIIIVGPSSTQVIIGPSTVSLTQPTTIAISTGTKPPAVVTSTTTSTIANTLYYTSKTYYYTNSYPPGQCYPNGCYPYSYTYGNGYPYPYRYQYPYQYATTVTVTNYSLLTETSTTTSATTSIPNPVFITNTLTTTAVTTDTTLEAVLGTLMTVFLALFLVTLFLLMRPRRATNNPQPVQQAYIATSYRCSACGTDVGPNAKFCGNCGAPLRS